MARAAVRSLDIQDYIWHGDRSGTLLLEAVRQAADRGVRVRMLLDDNGIAGMDSVLAALDRHPNIEIRLFNPFVLRSRSEEHTSELQSLMRISYAVFCLKKKNTKTVNLTTHTYEHVQH